MGYFVCILAEFGNSAFSLIGLLVPKELRNILLSNILTESTRWRLF